jgi:hypothetical protein
MVKQLGQSNLFTGFQSIIKPTAAFKSQCRRLLVIFEYAKSGREDFTGT